MLKNAPKFIGWVAGFIVILGLTGRLAWGEGQPQPELPVITLKNAGKITSSHVKAAYLMNDQKTILILGNRLDVHKPDKNAMLIEAFDLKTKRTKVMKKIEGFYLTASAKMSNDNIFLYGLNANDLENPRYLGRYEAKQFDLNTNQVQELGEDPIRWWAAPVLTNLPSNKILISGMLLPAGEDQEYFGKAEIFDPGTFKFNPIPLKLSPRIPSFSVVGNIASASVIELENNFAIELDNNQIALLGGLDMQSKASIEIIDSKENKLIKTVPSDPVRLAEVLPDGRIIMVIKKSEEFNDSYKLQIFDPESGAIDTFQEAFYCGIKKQTRSSYLVSNKVFSTTIPHEGILFWGGGNCYVDIPFYLPKNISARDFAGYFFLGYRPYYDIAFLDFYTLRLQPIGIAAWEKRHSHALSRIRIQTERSVLSDTRPLPFDTQLLYVPHKDNIYLIGNEKIKLLAFKTLKALRRSN